MRFVTTNYVQGAAIGTTRSIFYLVLLALAVFYLLPVYLIVLTGLKPFNEVDLKTRWNLPTNRLHIENFITAFNSLRPTSRTASSWIDGWGAEGITF